MTQNYQLSECYSIMSYLKHLARIPNQERFPFVPQSVVDQTACHCQHFFPVLFELPLLVPLMDGDWHSPISEIKFQTLKSPECHF